VSRHEHTGETKPLPGLRRPRAHRDICDVGALIDWAIALASGGFSGAACSLPFCLPRWPAHGHGSGTGHLGGDQLLDPAISLSRKSTCVDQHASTSAYLALEEP